MFCKWCGNKIKNNGIPCPTCGKEQDALENGNGFWDLYESGPNENRKNDVSLLIEKETDMDEIKQNQADSNRYQNNEKPSTNSGTFLLISGILFLMTLAGLIVSCISLIRTYECLKQIDILKIQMSEMTTEESNEPFDLMELIDTEKIENGVHNYESLETIDVDDELGEILSSEYAINIVNGVISLESHWINSSRGDIVLIVSGYPVENENSRILWQRYNEMYDEWDTIIEDQNCFLMKITDNINDIRVLCINQDETDEYIVYGAYCSINEMNDYFLEDFFRTTRNKPNMKEDDSTDPMTSIEEE